MKYSTFNELIKLDNNKKYIYNSLSNCLLQIEDDMYSKFESLSSDSSSLNVSNMDTKILNKLSEFKIFTENDEVEIDRLHMHMLASRFDATRMNLTIAPTRACNFNCTYCYEVFRPAEHMTKNTEDKILDFVKKSNPKKLHITWYGGEPLLKFETIERLSNKLSENGIVFSGMLITNGYLLTKNIISKLGDCEIKSIQFTLDGVESVHDKRRMPLSGGKTYKRILLNITELLKSSVSQNMIIKIRINVDQSNINDYSQVKESLQTKFLQYNRNIVIYPGWVTGETNPDLPCLSKSDISEFTLSNSKSFFPNNSMIECMARHVNSFLIGPNGDLYKCWHNLGNENYKLGNIYDDRLIINDLVLSKFIIGTDPFLHQECRKCKILPICWGGCPMERFENKFLGKNHNTCSEHKNYLSGFIKKHISSK